MKIIFWWDKHGEYAFDASTPEAWAASSVEILRMRLDAGYIYDPGEWEQRYDYQRFQEQNYPTDEQMIAMPEEYKKAVHAARAKLEKQRLSHEAEGRKFLEIQRIVAENDTSMVTIGRGKSYERQEPLAWRHVEDRGDHEYERVELMEVWTGA